MKKSKKELVSIRKFMEDYLNTPYEKRSLTKQQRRNKEELEVKQILGISLAKSDLKRLKQKKHVLTFQGMNGYLISKKVSLPQRVSFEQAEKQDHVGEKYVYVRDDTDRVIPYAVPERLVVKEKHPMNSIAILRNRIHTLSQMALECREIGDIHRLALVQEQLVKSRTDLYFWYLDQQDFQVKEDIDSFEVTEKTNRMDQQAKIYKYGKRGGKK